MKCFMILVQFSLVIVKHSQKFSVKCICVRKKKKKENEKNIVKKKKSCANTTVGQTVLRQML